MFAGNIKVLVVVTKFYISYAGHMFSGGEKTNRHNCERTLNSITYWAILPILGCFVNIAFSFHFFM